MSKIDWKQTLNDRGLDDDLRRVRNVTEPKADIEMWAIDKVRAMTGLMVYDRESNVGAVVNAFARYVMTKEEATVDPDLLEARQMAIDNLEGISEDAKSTYTNGIQSGEYDAENRVGVKLALAAIKRGRELERGEVK